MNRILFAGVLSVVAAPACAPPPELIEGEDLLVLDGVTLIDGTGAGPADSVVVVLEGDRIKRIGRSGAFRFPDDAELLDLRGRWLLPGFIEMHAHIPGRSLQEEVLRTYLGFGVTTLLNPGASPVTGIEARAALAEGRLTGPTMFTAGRIINESSWLDGAAIFVTVGSEAAAREEVRRQAESGVDLIKVYAHLSPNLVAAVIDEAHARGLKVTGHVGRTSWREAIDAGIDIVVHSALAGPTWELLPPSEQARFRGNIMPPADAMASYDASLFREWRDQIDLEDEPFQTLVADIARAGITVDPNLVVWESIAWGDDENHRELLEPDAGPEAWAEAWRAAGTHPLLTTWDAEDFAEAKATWPMFLDMVRQFHGAGIRLTAGSDLVNAWITPGVAWHRELELLVSAGIPVLDVLSIATRNGAQTLGIEDQVGTVEEGKLADLVVLSASPLENIRNTRTVRLVFHRGVRFVPEELLAR